VERNALHDGVFHPPFSSCANRLVPSSQTGTVVRSAHDPSSLFSFFFSLSRLAEPGGRFTYGGLNGLVAMCSFLPFFLPTLRPYRDSSHLPPGFLEAWMTRYASPFLPPSIFFLFLIHDLETCLFSLSLGVTVVAIRNTKKTGPFLPLSFLLSFPPPFSPPRDRSLLPVTFSFAEE